MISLSCAESNMTINTNQTSMFDAEEVILQTSTLKVRQLTSTADSLVKKLYATPKGMYRPTIEETLADALLVNNYIYIPGGHWIPAQCLPRWKVCIKWLLKRSPVRFVHFFSNLWRFWCHKKAFFFSQHMKKFHSWKAFRLEDIDENVPYYGNHIRAYKQFWVLDFHVKLKFLHCAGFLLLCMTTFATRTIKILRVHKLTLPHLKVKE